MNIDFQGNVLKRHQSIPDCQKCQESKKILDQNNIKYTVINAYKKFFGSLTKITKSTQIPQLIINGEFIGDYDQLVKYFNKENDENS